MGISVLGPLTIEDSTGDLLADNRGHRTSYNVVDIDYTRDGSRIAVTDSTGRVHLVEPLVGRDFTEAEWSRWFGTRPYRTTCPEP